MLLSLYRSLWGYRGFILGSVKREFQARYRNSLFGALWTVLNPLSMIVVYTVIFSHIMRARLPGVDDGMAYSVYLCAGLLTWGLFAEITLRSQSMFLENANLLKKISFPRICLPVIVLFNAGINFAIIIGLVPGLSADHRASAGHGVAGADAAAGVAGDVLRRAGDDPRRAECVLPRCRAILRHLPAILVLADADRVPDERSCRTGHPAPAAAQPDDHPDDQLSEPVSLRPMAGLEFAAADLRHRRWCSA